MKPYDGLPVRETQGRFKFLSAGNVYRERECLELQIREKLGKISRITMGKCIGDYPWYYKSTFSILNCQMSFRSYWTLGKPWFLETLWSTSQFVESMQEALCEATFFVHS